jgi:hypothetical protein
MMTLIDVGSAPKVRRRRKRKQVMSPEEKLAGFRSPTASAAEVRELVQNHILSVSEFENEEERAFVMWFVASDLARKVKDPKPEPDRRAAKAEAEAAKQGVVEILGRRDEERIETEATARLLEWVTPYNRPLKDCTGAECARLGRRLGGFFAELAKRLTPGETVGAHFSEFALQEFAKPYRLIGPRATR